MLQLSWSNQSVKETSKKDSKQMVHRKQLQFDKHGKGVFEITNVCKCMFLYKMHNFLCQSLNNRMS